MTSITYVITSLDRGGAETHLMRTLPGLRDAGFDATLITLKRRGELAAEFEDMGIKVYGPAFVFPRSGKFSKAFWYLCRLIQLFFHFLCLRPKIVHFILPESYVLGGLVSLITFVPKKIMSRRSLNNYQSKYPSIIRKLEKFLHKRMDLIIGNSQKVVDQLIQDEGAPAEKVQLVYNGLSEPLAPQRDMRQELELAPDQVVMCKIANLIPYKGHRDLLEACSKLQMSQNWALLLVGQDFHGHQKDLTAYADELGIAKKVKFLGARNDVPEILAASDIGVLASHEEGFSNAILEGMGYGLPMVVTDVGGNAEAVLDQECGYVVPSKSPDQLNEALNKLIKDAEKRHQMGQAGKQRQQQEFSLNRCVSHYVELYQKLV